MAAASRKIIRNLASVLRNPAILGDYFGWLASSALTGGKPSRRLFGSIEIGGFTNFSEYHSVVRFIDEPERRFFESFTGDGVILDVGANIGVVSLFLARRFPDRVIHAFEPNPTTFEALEANVARNGGKNIVCHRTAVSEAVGTVMFNNDPIERGTASISKSGGAFVQEVPATTLDAFVAEQGIDKVSLFKIDVEGYETLVFRGAHCLLTEIRPAMIYFEVCPPLTERAGFTATEPAQMLADAGYALHRLADDGGLIPVVPHDMAGLEYENWLAVRR
jgi:FkbM family methyltransferase